MKRLMLLLMLIAGVHANTTTHSYGLSNVQWSQCDGMGNRTYECATLHVPIDHWAAVGSSSNNKSFSIPLKRLMANENAYGTILLNPGGPGGSGIAFLDGYGIALDTILGGQWDLLGFDPRCAARGHFSCGEH